MDPSKIQTILSAPMPKDLTAVRSFVGLASYYRQFVQDFGRVAEPLSRLTRKHQRFQLTEEQQKAFDILKEKLVSQPIMCQSDHEKPIELKTDASGVGIRAVLLHVYPDKRVRLETAVRVRAELWHYRKEVSGDRVGHR